MPRTLDLRARKQEIAEATMTVLARGGSKALTVKALATELGGSTTLITHIYPRKSDLYDGVLSWLESDLELSLQSAGDDLMGLRTFIEWCLPTDERSLAMERARLSLLTRADDDVRIREFLDNLEERMRSLIRERLAPIVRPEELETLTLYVRAVTNGAVLSAAEHPGKWTRQRQVRAASILLDSILSFTTPGAPDGPSRGNS
ncbi:TetR family transcriptional regulator C-terminal domain-containing protein [Microbacterium insulae]|uniref:TetR family transcriptional regulator C-terminal domain-containing protein n=1 Tax=Microbacterium insulae TaxID=483014 RepID=A0ABW3AFB6_9MICO